MKFNLLFLFLLIIFFGCSNQDSNPVLENSSSSYQGTEENYTNNSYVLAAHQFVKVGDTVNYGNIGDILEIIQSTDTVHLNEGSSTLTCISSGAACIRAKYRESDSQNDIQTKCILCVDSVGSCEGKEKFGFDFQQFSDVEGNSNWLESGENEFYGVCKENEELILQQTKQELPELYFTIVDALGDGAYSLGDDELYQQREGVITTFSGDNLKPNWLISVGFQIDEVYLDEQVNVHIVHDSDCSIDVSCSDSQDLVQEGDFVEIGWGLSPEELDKLIDKYEEENPELLDNFLKKYGIESFTWDDLDSIPVDDNAKKFVFYRLVSLEIADIIFHHYDDKYSLREKHINISWIPPWYSYGLYLTCGPWETESQFCTMVDETIMDIEKNQINEWRSEGFDLWVSFPFNMVEHEDGVHLESWDKYKRPHFSNFNGIIVNLQIGSFENKSKDEIADHLSQSAKELVDEFNLHAPEKPIILRQSAPPLTLFTEGIFCEADFCPSDFKYSYLYTEKVFLVFLENLDNRFVGFSAAMFEGSHFDIKNAVEDKSGYELNRIGETGYNNPVLNIYSSK